MISSVPIILFNVPNVLVYTLSCLMYCFILIIIVSVECKLDKITEFNEISIDRTQNVKIFEFAKLIHNIIMPRY